LWGRDYPLAKIPAHCFYTSILRKQEPFDEIMGEDVNIITIGFDGPHRAGKGRNGLFLQSWLEARYVQTLQIRGDGAREGLGQSPGDPLSAYWQDVNSWIRTDRATSDDWHAAAYRLGRELIVWRDRVLPCMVRREGGFLGVLLVDRTLLSRTMVLRDQRHPDIAGHLYAHRPGDKGRRITAADVCPDIIFNLHVPRDELLKRLNPNIPKYAFRRRMIERASTWYVDAVDYLPQPLQQRVVPIDASRHPRTVFNTIMGHLIRRFEAFELLDLVETP